MRFICVGLTLRLTHETVKSPTCSGGWSEKDSTGESPGPLLCRM